MPVQKPWQAQVSRIFKNPPDLRMRFAFVGNLGITTAMESIKVAIVGASGYTGSELVRLVLLHPQIELTAVTSRTEEGRELSEVFPRYKNLPGASVRFIAPDADEILKTGAKAAFLALPHGVASDYAKDLLARGIRVIDLSADFRLNDPAVYEEFYGAPHPTPELLKKAVYGMPELHGEEIKSADLVASPGCYPTSIILPLAPLLKAGIIEGNSVQAFSMSGVSGAGKNIKTPAFLYVECNESVRAYGLPKHRHLSEIEQELSLAASEPVRISFSPHLVPVTSGIASTITATFAGSDPDQITEALTDAYSGSDFVRLLGKGVCADTKHVTRTNFVDIGWHFDSRTKRVVITSAEDNLVKGAGGQALQSFNLMFGLQPTTGLVLA